ncbi:MAG: hypothetical protein Q7T78_01565 [Rhodoferax sp.]|nr:hypothetical protein [Rhodoferax sp.]
MSSYPQARYQQKTTSWHCQTHSSGTPSTAPKTWWTQLGHGKKGPPGSAYDRAEYLPQRQQMMQTWADYLDKLRTGAEVIQFKAA